MAIAVALAFLTPHVGIGFDIATNRAIDMLIAAGASTVTFIGIVFSLLFLVVQFGSTTFTPRLTRFRDAPTVWRAFALYAAVVVYSFTAALVIGRDQTTSGVAPIVASVGVLASLIAYRQLQLGAFKSIQLASTLAQVASRGSEVIDGLYTPNRPRTSSPAGANSREIRWPGRSGILHVIDVPRILRAADRHDATIELKVGSGDPIAEETVVAVTARPAASTLAQEVLAALTVGEERIFEQDSARAPGPRGYRLASAVTRDQ